MSDAASGLAWVRIDADLEVEIDGLTAQVAGHGDVVQVVADRPLALMRHVSTSSVPRLVEESVPSWGSRLAAHDLRLELRSPRGLVGAVGAPAGSSAPGRMGRHWHVEPGPASVVAAEMAHEVGVAVRRRRGVIITVLSLIALAIGARTIRRHRYG